MLNWLSECACLKYLCEKIHLQPRVSLKWLWEKYICYCCCCFLSAKTKAIKELLNTVSLRWNKATSLNGIQFWWVIYTKYIHFDWSIASSSNKNANKSCRNGIKLRKGKIKQKVTVQFANHLLSGQFKQSTIWLNTQVHENFAMESMRE